MKSLPGGECSWSSYLASRGLANRLSCSLPGIKTKILQQRSSVGNQLTGLPEIPSNIELEIRKSLSQFTDRIKKVLTGPEFSSEWNALCRQFRQCIINAKPRFTVADPADRRKVIEIGDSDDDGLGTAAVPSTPTTLRKRPPENLAGSAARKMRLQSTAPSACIESPISANALKKESYPTGSPAASTSSQHIGQQDVMQPNFCDQFALYQNLGRSFMSIREIRQELNATARSGLPDIVNPEVYSTIAVRAVSKWDQPLNAFINATMGLLKRKFGEALAMAFTNLQRRLVYKESVEQVNVFLEEKRKRYDGLLRQQLSFEKKKLFTLDEETFSRHRIAEMSLLQQARHYYRWKSYNGNMQLPPFKEFEKMNDEERSKEAREREKQSRILGPDTWNRELGVAAYVRGYYLTAASRFSENCTIAVYSGMFDDISDDIDFYLEQKLGITGAVGEFFSLFPCLRVSV